MAQIASTPQFGMSSPNQLYSISNQNSHSNSISASAISLQHEQIAVSPAQPTAIQGRYSISHCRHSVLQSDLYEIGCPTAIRRKTAEIGSGYYDEEEFGDDDDDSKANHVDEPFPIGGMNVLYLIVLIYAALLTYRKRLRHKA